MTFVKEDHEALGLAMRPEQDKGSTAWEKMLRIFLKRWSDLETVIEAWVLVSDFADAAGHELEDYAELLNFAILNGVGTVQMRTILELRAKSVRSSGTGPQLIEIAAALSPTSISTLIRQPPKAFELQIADLVDPTLISVAPILVCGAAAAGETCNLVTYDSDEYFGFFEDSDPGALGYDDGFYATTI